MANKVRSGGSLISVPDDGLTDLIDYIRCSFPYDAINTRILPDMRCFQAKGEVLPRGLYGYTRTLQTLGGAMLMWNPDDPRKGVCLQVSGMALNQYRGEGGTTQELFNIIDWFGGKPSRIDYARDVVGSKFNMNDIRQAWHAGQIATMSRTWGWRESDETCFHHPDRRVQGKTAYIGSRNSPKMLRVYDKAAELQLLDLAWVRVEMEFKKRKVKPVFESMLRRGYSRVGQAEMASHAVFGIDWLDSAIDHQNAEEGVEVGRTEKNDVWFWENQVKPWLKNLNTKTRSKIMSEINMLEFE